MGHFFDPLICWWALRLLPALSYCKLGCCEHWGAQVLLNWCSGTVVYDPSSGIAGSKCSSISSFLSKFHTVCHSVYTSLHSHQHYTGVPFSPQLFLHLLFVDLFMIAILTGVKWYLIVVLIHISLMASDAEHPFICLWALSMSSWEK